ncbi:LruC domain-containing protein [Desertivirga xinjiangensis]|uniref:LruC domain-containing protein n=1 Tax=Desertivirga xinjiangensis TaxID=539206 RepID=UPI002109BE68|nr:LruC domain-containing protein [Pedobacter xinjiangensis]
MKKKFLLSLLFISTLAIYSCKKDGQSDGQLNVDKLTDVKVPDGFTWESSRDVTFDVSVTDVRFSDAIHQVAIYGTDGTLYSKGSATLSAPFKTKVYLPSTIEEVFVVKTAPDNSSVSQKVQVRSSYIALSLGASLKLEGLSAVNTSGTSAISPDCTSGCNQSILLTQNWQNVSVSNGQTVCLTGSNKIFNVELGSGGGTLKICGTGLTVQNLNKNSGTSAVEIIVSAGSNVSFSNLDLDRSSHVLKNYGTVTFSGNLACSGKVNNYGALTVNGDYNINSGNVSGHTNDGVLTVGGTMNVNSTTSYTNNASATIKKLQVNSNGVFNNNCKLIVVTNTIIDKTLNNYGYVSVGTSTQINANAKINLYSGALFVTKDLEKIGGHFVGNAGTSLVNITGTIDNNLILDANQTSNGQKFIGPLQVCYKSTLTERLFKEGAVQGCDLYIAPTGCTPGNGESQVADSDGDGVSDNLDDYPNDPEKAYDNYYPGPGSNAGATVAFEDQWPVKGDYDMNDVVMSYQLKVVTDAQNKVVEVAGTYNLQARGGIFHNGFGIEFPVSRSSVSDVIGGTLEEGQQKAVIILFDNMHAEMYSYNTRKEEAVLPAKSYPISFKVSNGPLLADFGLSEYNPFIWNKVAGRGYEIHLPGRKPTSLADVSLFGTGDDNSSVAAGRYYISPDGYPWAISIPVKEFNYPVEGKDIVKAYLRLPMWISSGGSSYTDWYSNTGSGYRNTSNLFK